MADVIISGFTLSTILGGYVVQGGAVPVRAQATGITTDTNTNIYTVPVGSKSVLVAQGTTATLSASNAFVTYWNVGAVGTQTCFLYVQFGGTGTRYRITGNASITAISTFAASTNTVALGQLLVLSAGDVVGVNSSASAGGATTTASISLLNIPSSDPLTSSYVTDPAAGNNAFTAVATGKNRRILSGAVNYGVTQQYASYHVNAAAAQNVYNTYNGIQIDAAVSITQNVPTVKSPAAGTSGAGIFPQAAADTMGANWAGANTGGLSWITYVEI